VHREISESQPGLLAIAERGIGDGLTLLPSLRALRLAHPDLRIELIAPGLVPLTPNLRETATVLDPEPLVGLTTAERLGWLRDRQVQWVWNTERRQGPWSYALQGSQNPNWLTAPGQRDWGDRQVLPVRFDQLRVLFPNLPAPQELTLSLTAEQEITRASFRSSLPQPQRLIAIQPGAGDANRIWPAESFRAVASALTEDPGITVLFFLSEAEAHFRAPGFLPDRANLRWLCEPLDRALPRLAACDLLIGNDSGFYHLAVALGLKVVGIYGSRRGARRWAYRLPRTRTMVPWLPRPFRRDWRRWVSVRRVLRAARSLL
jgi:Glycosyltransferase family 9 (heptosyltransferase)